MIQSERLRRTPDRILQIVILFYQGIALIVFATLPFLAANWLSTVNRGLAEFLIPYLVGLAFLAIGLWIFWIRRMEASGRSFGIFAASAALAFAARFDLVTTHWFPLLWAFSLACTGAALIELALLVPREVRWAQGRPYLRWAGYVAGLALFILAAIQPHDFTQAIPWPYLFILCGLAVILFLTMIFVRGIASRSPVVRQQARSILWGAVIAFGPLAIWFLLAALPKNSLSFLQLANFPPILLLFTVAFPLVTGFGILRYRLLRTDYLLRRGISYALLSILILAGYILLVSGLVLIFGQSFQVTNPLFIGLAVLILALGLNPLRNGLQGFVDSVFFRGIQAYEQRLREFNHELTGTVELATIIHTLRQHIDASMSPERLHVYIFDPLSDQYLAAAGEDGRATSDLRFATTSALTQALGRSEIPLFFDESALPVELNAEKTRLALLDAVLFVPLPGSSGHPVGWLALGPRRSGEQYGAGDVDFLSQISSAAAIAIERAQVIANQERRLREMNILARVAQGVNITVAFDDILELIYAQTDQVLPVDNFHITLHNRERDYFYFAFCLEKDERLNDRENLPLPEGTDLSPLVIRNRRPILTADYEYECRARGVTPYSPGIHAWVGVPLNAGAETIGALSVGSCDAGVVYTPAQQELLQSIAEQTAGAIVKARLLLETQHRARQLSILNDITRQLTSTLETEPLLQNILDSAITILNCEAGSFFLVDETTDELVFRATAGPVAHDLVGQRLPAGSGIVGRAVERRAPVVENDAQHSPVRFKTDEQTGFVSRSLLAIPLIVKENVIGVLEVINRKDGLPFVEDDQNLLSAFGAQASVAIENARLYTLTDQELNDRVDELSVMQRIDRELNASLDVGRAMGLTLEWAMRQSRAEAGLIGVLESKGVRLTAQQGYDEIEQTYKEGPMPLDQPAMRKAAETGQPQRMELSERQPGLLAGARTQIVVPIRRETNVIGLIVMESRSTESQPVEAMTFLARLSDHAAIAIANAQLYHEVESANQAKSEFVSFVAHELKNPMTSIKGYTELLAKGAVGPVTDMQSNFLGTIHSNVERMSTLVSDLNDNSKIEAGRLRLDFKAVNIAEVVDEVMRSTKRQIEDRKQTASMNLPAEAPKIWADPTRLTQIIVNLVSNANKYTPEGGLITIGAEKSANQWDADGAAEVLHIWVKDSGIGISLEDQKKIFQKFFRSEDSKAREAPGTGLGLNITRSLVEMMGGRIWFESEFRQGTTFHFTVPVAQG
jgi:signal transduction histidine kinase